MFWQNQNKIVQVRYSLPMRAQKEQRLSLSEQVLLLTLVATLSSISLFVHVPHEIWQFDFIQRGFDSRERNFFHQPGARVCNRDNNIVAWHAPGFVTPHSTYTTSNNLNWKLTHKIVEYRSKSERTCMRGEMSENNPFWAECIAQKMLELRVTRAPPALLPRVLQVFASPLCPTRTRPVPAREIVLTNELSHSPSRSRKAHPDRNSSYYDSWSRLRSDSGQLTNARSVQFVALTFLPSWPCWCIVCDNDSDSKVNNLTLKEAPEQTGYTYYAIVPKTARQER